ncbi:AcrR family transcriptional regulator [Mycolicibacterium sp. BK556]|uniref:TetR/AcrR family transcriptional regulator n=1 Tax=unclassified Mycolicibacterium TaxID=2636767 RepID=UPI00161A5945|nr:MULTISPECIES: TetR/AcrR family transcriptional regulator [unclassified Mycolicibacterium]MBB3605092.1 AcrR family transcriptional regulator [Mycolicibacterium sp. BK556]MBB3635288.1 AcrR family transcriptional regulator [Mycolicibacterium sp. BK607]MBB3747918.1 AcrR family transcriptional regulator [Mycolicibacterium sp. BK634]
MAPPRKHETDAILDAARGLLLAEGPRAASVAAIAKASGAPVGTLYHRFGNRDGVVTAVWLRALERFQARAMAASGTDPVEVAVQMAVAAVGFATDCTEDARLLLTIRPVDLRDAGPDPEFDATLATMNAPLVDRVAELARQLYGRADARSVDAVTRAVVDLPYAVVRRHAHDDGMPSWVRADVAASVRALLTAHSPASPL